MVIPPKVLSSWAATQMQCLFTTWHSKWLDVSADFTGDVAWPGVGVTKPISSVPLFSEFLEMSKESLAIEYHVYIWQVSPQLSCGDICQIWMCFE